MKGFSLAFLAFSGRRPSDGLYPEGRIACHMHETIFPKSQRLPLVVQGGGSGVLEPFDWDLIRRARCSRDGESWGTTGLHTQLAMHSMLGRSNQVLGRQCTGTRVQAAFWNRQAAETIDSRVHVNKIFALSAMNKTEAS